jgi:hypothetical protein
MMTLLGLGLLAGALVLLVIAIQVIFSARDNHARKHRITGGIGNALTGQLAHPEEADSDELQSTMSIDSRNGELVVGYALSDTGARTN